MKNIIKLSLLALVFGGVSLEAGRGRGSKRLTEAGRIQRANRKAIEKANASLNAQRKAASDAEKKAIKRAQIQRIVECKLAERAKADREKAAAAEAARQKDAILRAQFEKDDKAKKRKLADCLKRFQEGRAKKMAKRNARKFAIAQKEAAQKEAADNLFWKRARIATGFTTGALATAVVVAGIKNPEVVKQAVKFGKKTMKPVCKAAKPIVKKAAKFGKNYAKKAWNFGKNLLGRFVSSKPQNVGKVSFGFPRMNKVPGIIKP